MKDYERQAILVLRIIGAIIVILIGGFWNLIITFSDYPSSWSTLTWFLYLLAWYALSAFLVGFLIPAAWYLAIITAFSSLILYGYPNIFFGLLVSVIAFGWIGSLLSIWRTRHAVNGRDEKGSLKDEVQNGEDV
jgi:uncharacterized membrane protein